MPSLAPPAGKPAEDPYTQYSTFLHPNFEADAFAHAVLNGEEYPAQSEGSNGVPAGGSGFMKGLVGENGTGDVSAALARLNFGVEDLNRQLKAEVTKNHSSLLLQAASLGGLDGDLAEVRRGLAEVEGGVTRLKRKIAAPHDALASSLLLLTRLRRAASLARRAQRFTFLARRLEGQMSEIDGAAGAGAVTVNGEQASERRERAMAEAALTLAEIESLLTEGEGVEAAEDDPEALLPIRSLNAIEAAIPAVELSRRRVVVEMESSVQRGLDEMDHPLLASSLQTAHNLSVLPALVENLIADLNDLVAGKVKACFDMASLAREIGGKEGPVNAASAFVYKSRTRNEPTPATMPQWAAAFWARLESLITDLGSICIKAYTLEKVLKLKKDQTTQASFLDEAMAVLDNKPSVLFWTSLAQAFETHAKEAVRSSNFVQTTLSTGYPRLLRLFQEFFSRIAVHTDTVYTLAQQSPETVLVLRAIQPFETLYLTRSTNRLTEAVSSAFSISSSLTSSFSSRPPAMPTANEGLTTARAIVNELDAARFDPLLAKAIAKGASRAVEAFVARAEALVAHDHAATSLLGPLATPSQHQNADLTSALYHLWLPLDRALPDHTESVRETLRPAVNRVRSVYTAIVNPLILAIRREFSALLARMHRVDYSKEVDPAHPPGPMSVGGASSYMNDLTEKLALIKDEIFAAYRVGELIKEWTIDLARFTVQTFLLHASLVHPIGESGKLKLTSDTTALEFAVNQYLAAQGLTLGNMGDQFKALRAFRPLLFLDLPSLADPTKTSDVPTLILLHHLLSRANLPNALPLPYELHGWTETEYVRWLNEHREEERMGMLESVARRWEEQKAKREEGDGPGGEQDDEADKVVGLIRQVLARTAGTTGHR